MHPLAEVEAVGGKPVHAGIEFEGHALLFARVRHQPIQQGITVALRPFRLVGDQVVDIKDEPRFQLIEQPEARDRHDPAIVDMQHQSQTQRLGLADGVDEGGLVEVEALLPHHGKRRGRSSSSDEAKMVDPVEGGGVVIGTRAVRGRPRRPRQSPARAAGSCRSGRRGGRPLAGRVAGSGDGVVETERQSRGG